MVYCKNCGKENKKGKYCQFCGDRLVKSSILKTKGILLIFLILFGILAVFEIISLNTSIEKENLFGNIKRVNYLLVGKEFCGNHNCIESELYNCKKDCVWCGDGTCQNDEIGKCYEDCIWCGDGYCEDNEDCNSCSKDCGSCKALSYCGDGVCNPGECQIGCKKDCPISQCENGICEANREENCVTAPNDCRCRLNENCNRETKLCEIITCGNSICEANENSLSCPNDCKEVYSEILFNPNKDLPIIFVHGHSPSEKEQGYGPTGWEEFQDKLVAEGYDNKGLILPSDYPPILTKGIWSSKKISVITTYYLNTYDKFGNIVGPDDNQNIMEYAERLKDVVEVVKHNTGKNKVIIIAHSMGGLVSRAYIKYFGGIDSVDKLVTVFTPNHGTHGYIAFGCGTFLAGREPTLECDDMKSGSSFLTSLNSPDETPGNIKYLTVIGLNKNTAYCPNNERWDDVICSSSVKLDGAENFEYVYNSTYQGTLHSRMIFPSKSPEVYNKIIGFLKSN